MRASRWFLGISALVVVGAGGIQAGCSSSSSGSPPPASGDDASMVSDGSGGDVATPSCHVDASLTAFAATDAAGAGCAACVQTMCSDAITACSNSCTCVGLFSCLADAGVSATGLTSDLGSLAACVPGGISSAGALLNDPGVLALYNCLSMTCSDQCAAVLPATDAGTADGGGSGDAGTAADTGTTTDAGDGG
jgi:hypothetical protein